MKNKGKTRWIIIFLCIILAGIIFAGMRLIRQRNQMVDKQRKNMRQEILKESEDELNTKNYETFTVLGVDSRDKSKNKYTRSDTIMVVCIDRDNKKIKIASIYRDSYVSIKGHGLDKITHAHAFGGAQLAVDTLNRNFDLDIKKYLVVNFLNVADIIDRLGGVSIDITDKELKYINGYIDEINRIDGTKDARITETGKQLLSGTQAVAYSRIRYTEGGEYKRAWRQQEVLMKLFETMKDKKDIELFKALAPVLDKIDTNYSLDDLSDLFSDMNDYDVQRSSFPKKLWGGKIEGVWYAVPVTLENTVKQLHQYLYEEEHECSQTVQTISDQIRRQKSIANEEPDKQIK